MSTRESRRHKERRSVIPFGDIMLPVIGLVAVGLLIVGVKLFFLSGERQRPYTPLPVQQGVPAPRAAPVASPLTPINESREDSPEQLLAIPVSPGTNRGEGVRVETPVAPPPAATPSPPQRPPAPPSNSNWGVQIGSFTTRQSAETVRQQAEKAGFSGAGITTAQVQGRTYFRVTVPAGNTRSDAVNLSQRLTKAGFPVFIVSLR